MSTPKSVLDQQPPATVPESRYRSLFATAFDGTLLVDAKSTQVIEVNPSLIELLGYPDRELLGKEFRTLPVFANAVTGQTFFRELMAAGRLRREDLHLRARDGRMVDVALVGSVCSDDGAERAQIGIRDMTAQRRADNYHRALAGNTLDILAVINSDGSVRYHSPAIERILGWRPEERIGQDAFALIHPDDRERVRALFRENLPARGNIRTTSYRCRHRDGTWRVMESIASNQLDDPDIRGIIVNSRDITERRQTEAKLRENERRYRAIFEQAAVGVALVDSQTGRCVQINQRLCDIVGRSAAEMAATPLSALTHPDDLPTESANLSKLLAGRTREFTLEKRILHKNGATVWVILTVSRLWESGEAPSHHVAIVREITHRKRLEKRILEVSDREQRRIGQDLHDGLCQLLSGIKFQTGVLVQRLEQSGSGEATAAQGIENLLNTAIQQAHCIARGLSPVDLGSRGLGPALEELAETTARLYGVTCTFASDVPESGIDHSVSTHLYRIAQEAVHNAVKHGKAKTIRLSLAPRDGHLELAIRDNGTGIPPSTGSGGGMGLRIMGERARVMGGAFRLRPAAPTGVEAVCLLPLSALGGGTAHGAG